MKNRIQSRHDRRPDESFTGHPVNIVAGAFVGSRSGLENVRTDAVLIRGSSVGRVDSTQTGPAMAVCDNETEPSTEARGYMARCAETPVVSRTLIDSANDGGQVVTAGETARNSESALFRADGELTHGRNVREGTARNLATRNSVNADTIGQRCVTVGKDRHQFSSAWRSRQTQVISLLETAGDAAGALKSEDSFAIAAAVDGTPFTKAAGANPAALAFFPPNTRVNDPVGEAGRSGDSGAKVNPHRSGMRRRTVMPKLSTL